MLSDCSHLWGENNCRNQSGLHGGMPARYNSKRKHLAAGGGGGNDHCYDKNVHMTFMSCDESASAGMQAVNQLSQFGRLKPARLYHWVSLNVLKE